MNYKVVKGNIFNYKNCYYAHCISRDYALGMGIAKEFDIKYDMRKRLKSINDSSNCILIDNVFNLVTKDKYWYKPTYKSLTTALLEMKEKIINNHVNTLVMPKIGCGLDKLKWDNVNTIIQDIFKDIGITIIICYL